MQIIIPDSIERLEPLFTSRLSPRARFEQGQAFITAPDGLAMLLGSLGDARDSGAYGIMQAAMLDGYDVLESRQVYGLFNPGRKVEASEWQFATFREQDVPSQLQQHLIACANLAGDVPEVPQISAVLLPADPAHFQLMLASFGLSGFGAVPGIILVRLWPSAGNLERLGLFLTRLFVHTTRNAIHPPTTLGDFLALEGIAAAFIAARFPRIAAPWLVPFTRPADWDAALTHIAALYALPRYDAIKTNIFGGQDIAENYENMPLAQPLAADDLAYAEDIIMGALAEDDPTRIAAYLYGDAIVARQGHPAIGLPPFAGFEVAHRCTRAYLARSGASLADLLRAPAADVLA